MVQPEFHLMLQVFVLLWLGFALYGLHIAREEDLRNRLVFAFVFWPCVCIVHTAGGLLVVAAVLGALYPLLGAFGLR